MDTYTSWSAKAGVNFLTSNQGFQIKTKVLVPINPMKLSERVFQITSIRRLSQIPFSVDLRQIDYQSCQVS
jgi:predicted CoA-binding protein